MRRSADPWRDGRVEWETDGKGGEERRREGEERRRREGRGVGLGNSVHVAGLRKGESRAAAGVNLQNCKSLQNFSVLEALTHIHTQLFHGFKVQRRPMSCQVKKNCVYF